jgi:pimeloyl-ACP methyl ester carboxylesterase
VSGNTLDIPMSLRKDGVRVELDSAALAGAFPQATPRVCVFVHGLMCNEWSWSLYARDVHGDPSTNYGTLLQKDLGYTPVYVRYNTGRRIFENGQDLADLLEKLVEAYPVSIEELVLVGHSMGGLVSRSACVHATEVGHRWVDRAKHVFSLGSPHLGAPLEKAGHLFATALDWIDHPATKVPARLINGRSAGIKDLREGVIRDDWIGKDPNELVRDTEHEVAFVSDVAYYFVAGTVTLDPEHPLGQLIGDFLVLAPSAAGDHPSLAHRVPLGERRSVVLGGVSHMRLLNHPGVYAQIRAWCSPRDPIV